MLTETHEGGEPEQTAPDPQRQAIQAAIDDGVTQAQLAREVGVSGTTLSQWLRRMYKGDEAAIQAKVATWLASREAGAAARLPTAPRWAETPTSVAIKQAMLFAQKTPAIAVVYGGAGVGKTTALRRYVQENPNVWVVTASPAAASVAAVLEDLAAALDLRGLPNRPSTVSREIVRRVQNTRGLLVIDEAQHLGMQALEEVRAIYDASGIGLVLSGNEAVYARLTGGQRKATFAQLFSRIGMKLKLGMPTDGDVIAVMTEWGISGAKEVAYGRQIASMPGGLRGLTHTLRQALIAAGCDAGAVDVHLMRAAWRELGGES